jgi:hypothetical protein
MKRIVWIIVIVIAAASSPGAQQRDGVQAFAQRAETYTELHRQLEKTVAPEELFVDPATMLAASDRLRAMLRAARAGAQEGDVFAPVAGELSRRIRQSIREHGIEARDLMVEMVQDTEGTPPPVRVNEPFSWLHGNVMPVYVLEALPPLPRELEYRFVGADLVLIDVHANMIVDILRNVLPARASQARPFEQ